MRNYLIVAGVILTIVASIAYFRQSTFGVATLSTSDTQNTERAVVNNLVALANSFSTTTNNTWTGTNAFTSWSISATSTGSNGIALTGGCFSINGTCITTSAVTGGRSLTLSGSTLDADSELYTFGIAANLFATTTSGISTTTEYFVDVRVPVASTITGYTCYADDTGTSTIKATVTSNPLIAGTNILYSSGAHCGSQFYLSTSTFSTTAVSAGSIIRFYVSDAEPTGSRPRVLHPNFTLTADD